MTDKETATDIDAMAAQWVWRLDRDGRTQELEHELEAWLAGDPRRRGAFLRAEAAWVMMDRAQWKPEESAPVRPARRHGVFDRRAVLFGGLAASVAAAGAFLLRPERFTTRIGEIRRLSLKDGSLAEINTASTIEVSLKSQQRVIRMDQGEAWFQVAKDATRPFVVEAGNVRVRAVGTAFGVRRRHNGADIMVTEGVVETWTEGSKDGAVRLKAGEKAYVTDAEPIGRIVSAPSQIDRELAWRDGNIDLAGESLGEAVEEFNRHNSRKLVIAQASIADEPLYGVFHANDPQAFAKAIEVSLDVKVTVEDNQIIIGSDPRS